MLKFSGVTKVVRDGSNALKTILAIDELTVADRTLCAVMGPSGSGKTTLAMFAAAVEIPTLGYVQLDDINLAKLSMRDRAKTRRRHIGVVFQNDELDPLLTALENVALPLQLDGMKSTDALAEAETALQRCAITDLATRFRSDLSGGQRQRVAVARAITGDRKLIVADEPTAALDSATARSVVELLCELASSGVSVLMTTHDARLAGFANQTVLLRDGTLVREADLNERSERQPNQGAGPWA